jgi:predicted O-methyltransferase YrrM
MAGIPGPQARWTGDQSFVGYVLGPGMPTFTEGDGVTHFRASWCDVSSTLRNQGKQYRREEKYRRVCAGHGETPRPELPPSTAPDYSLIFFCGPAKPRTFIDQVFWIRAALDQRPASEKSDRERLAHLGKPCSQHKVLTYAVKAFGWTRGAEIGVLRGKTFFALLDACPDLAMIGVDQWRQLPFREDENAETYQAFDMEGFYESVRERCRSYGDRAHILRGDSVDMAASLEDGSLDFVFIDGDHTEPGFRRDLLAWAPKVKADGVVFGHDYSWPTVQRVLDELAPKWTAHTDEVWSCPRGGVMV